MTGKLLIVDDSATDRMIIQNMLKDYHVITACDGQEAIGLIEENQDIDLVILDINMPVMNGFEVLKKMNAIDPDKRMRAIILTNYDELDNEIQGLKAGAVDFIRKPINMESLRLRIAIHLELLKIQKLYQQALFERNLTLDLLLNQAPIGIVLSHGLYSGSNEDERAVYNQAYERITGRQRDELISLGWQAITHPDDLERELALYRGFQTGETNGYSMEKRFVRPDGSLVWVYTTLAHLKLQRESEFNYICLVQDITERKAAESALLESERSKSVLLANLPGLAYRCSYDPQWTMHFISDACFDLTGYRSECLLENRDLSFNDLIVPEYRQKIWDEYVRVLKDRLPFKYEYEIITANGCRKWVLEMGQGIYDDRGEVEALEGIIIDISDRKEKEIELQHISEIDSLTKLHNRGILENILLRDANAKAEGKRAVVLISLRKLNSISLTYGYNFCEQIVVELTESLQSLIDKNKSLYQVSFERYAFYITKYHDEKDLESFSETIIDLIDEIQILRTIGCGIGILEFDCRDCVPENIIKNASTAAERIDREQIFGYRFFNREMENTVKREGAVKEALVRLVDGAPDVRLYLQFQPILNLKTNSVEEFEALARFQSETLGKVSPLEFISIAEETQMIIEIGKSVLKMSCEFQKRLQSMGYKQIRIFVNVSAVQLLRSEFLADFIEIVQSYGLSPKSFGLEITESIFAGNFNVINDKLEKLMEIGVKISIDDFGTGYSTLARERDMKVNILKIDKSFINGLMCIPSEQAITRDIIAMAHRMGHKVVAEGVEYEEQKQYLMDNHCDMIQGYLFSKPLDEDAVFDFLKDKNSK
ncbi:MAG TPA: EAL domain-containing protein [Candidatus Limiplasma sp.]|nr:EAL domain-containing protein [Candidatus Limiplasma sp.]